MRFARFGQRLRKQLSDDTRQADGSRQHQRTLTATTGARKCEIRLRSSVLDLVGSRSPAFCIFMASQPRSMKRKSRLTRGDREDCSIFTNITVRSPSRPQVCLNHFFDLFVRAKTQNALSIK